MSVAEKILISGAAYFLMQSYVFGVVKYRQMMTSQNSRANFYVNMSHNSPLLYIAAALLLTMLAHYSEFPDGINTVAAASIMLFYVSANVINNINAIKGVDHTAIRNLKADGGAIKTALNIYIAFLVLAQVGGSAVLATGAMSGLWA